VVETGVPSWLPEGVAGVVTTHGAGRASMEAAFELISAG
jgi:hypothetical protein